MGPKKAAAKKKESNPEEAVLDDTRMMNMYYQTCVSLQLQLGTVWKLSI